MEYICETPSSAALSSGILCCECGTLIEPNPSNMCVTCLTGRIDLSEGIPKQNTLYFCRGCERYLCPPNEWLNCSLESRELLSLCLKRLKGLNRVKLVDAGFVWTEPHSKRIKVKLVIQGEVIGGTILQQSFVIDFSVNHQMCQDCHRVEAKDFWKAVVQVRQKAENKKTFYYLEQLILKHKAHENSLGIKPIHEGLDFYYATEAHARKMVDFLSTVLPCRYQHSKKLLSHDVHSNTYNYKFTFSVEIVPISKDSLVCLSKKMAQQLGGISPLCIVLRVTNNIHLIDPTTAQLCEVSSTAYWREPFNSIFNPKQLIEYIVMDIEYLKNEERNIFPGQGPVSHKHLVSDVWLVKASELGINENPIHTRSHLGHLLKPGDSVLGYNLAECNVNDSNFDKLSKDLSYDVLLVKKHYGEGRRRKRFWTLKRLDREDDLSMSSSANRDYNEFLDDLEEDPLYRQNINIYRDWSKNIPVDTDESDVNEPKVSLQEMLDDMHICDD